MSKDWIDDVLTRMKDPNLNGNNEHLETLADEISTFIENGNNVTQIVSGVNKSTRELIILNINGF